MIKKLLDIKTEDCKLAEGIQFEQASTKDIAIIGIALRLPKAKNLEEYWSNIAGGVDCITEIPDARIRDIEDFMAFKGFTVEKYFEKGYLEEIDKFDYSFFGISPKEAALIDPNQRMFLETAWEAIEDAGYGGDRLKGSRTGVFLGFGSELFYKRLIDEVDPASGPVALPGNLAPVIASRIAYLLDLKGPSLVIDTTCSSALVALHYACQAIRSGECGMAIAGTVSLSLMPVDGGQRIGIESSDGKSRVFDDSSDGTGNGEGVAALILKPLHKAVDDRNHIYAIIKGSAVNQNGSSMGITAPNPAAEEDVIVRAWKNAGIDPETISYIEAAANGTKLGDPIEIDGIQRAFRRHTSKKSFCAIGSAKSKIGHLDSAAGIAGLIEAVEALTKRQLPPTIHFKRPNRQIAFEDSPVYVNDRLVDWEKGDTPRRCGVSSFGISGTNCHMILEEAPDEIVAVSKLKVKSSQGTHVLALSAKSEEALTVLLDNYRKFLKTAKTKEIADICYTADTGRGHYNYRAAFIIGEVENLSEVIKPFETIASRENISDKIFYGKHSVVNDKRLERASGEITRDELGKMDVEAGLKLEQFVAGDGSETDLLRELLTLYVKGATVAWNKLYKPGRNRTVRVPVYPFDRKRCWIDIPQINQENAAPATAQLSYHEGLSETLPDVILMGRKNGDDYTKTEKELGTIWGLVLGLTEINIYDDFFELGGHSLLAAKLEAELEKRGMLPFGVEVYQYKSINEMAAFLEGRLAEEPDRVETVQLDIIPIGDTFSVNVGAETVVSTCGEARVLENIHPFNDIYYISCFYNSFFPVLTYFNKSIKPFLINDIIKYQYKWLEIDSSVEYVPLQPFEKILVDSGIMAECKLQSYDIIGDIKESIDGGKPVIIWLDCYYESLRIDTYLKNHLSHTWLVFGYDDDSQCCHIVEHSRSDNLSYEKRVVRYWDVVNSYHGYLVRFQNESTDASFYSFHLSEQDKSVASDAEYIEMYMKNAALRYNEITEELDGLESFASGAGEFLMNEEFMQMEAEKIMNVLTSIINAKQVERYRFAQLFGEESEITKRMGEITECWNNARKPISRYVFSRIYNRVAMEKSTAFLKTIYLMEQKMCTEFIFNQNKEGK